jgi:hypothetical protein
VFSSLRIQWIEPCRARCLRCATWRKNPLFADLIAAGAHRRVHDFYLEAARTFRPQSLYVSGGEPLLSDALPDHLRAFGEHVGGHTFVFSSFQFSDDERERLLARDWPQERVVLTHTVTSMDPEVWARETGGFPFALYLRNLREVAARFPSKRIKFLLNHDDVAGQVDRFVEAVRPDASFVFSLKLVNLQAGRLQADVIEATRRLAQARLAAGTAPGDGDLSWRSEVTGEETLAALAAGGDPAACPYREAPRELRFAVRGFDPDRVRLYYRFCPFFPADRHFGFHIGRDSLDQIRLAYEKHKWHSWCPDCRLRRYLGPSTP